MRTDNHSPFGYGREPDSDFFDAGARGSHHPMFDFSKSGLKPSATYYPKNAAAKCRARYVSNPSSGANDSPSDDVPASPMSDDVPASPRSAVQTSAPKPARHPFASRASGLPPPTRNAEDTIRVNVEAVNQGLKACSIHPYHDSFCRQNDGTTYPGFSSEKVGEYVQGQYGSRNDSFAGHNSRAAGQSSSRAPPSPADASAGPKRDGRSGPKPATVASAPESASGGGLYSMATHTVFLSMATSIFHGRRVPKTQRSKHHRPGCHKLAKDSASPEASRADSPRGSGSGSGSDKESEGTPAQNEPVPQPAKHKRHPVYEMSGALPVRRVGINAEKRDRSHRGGRRDGNSNNSPNSHNDSALRRYDPALQAKLEKIVNEEAQRPLTRGPIFPPPRLANVRFSPVPKLYINNHLDTEAAVTVSLDPRVNFDRLKFADTKVDKAARIAGIIALWSGYRKIDVVVDKDGQGSFVASHPQKIPPHTIEAYQAFSNVYPDPDGSIPRLYVSEAFEEAGGSRGQLTPAVQPPAKLHGRLNPISEKWYTSFYPADQRGQHKFATDRRSTTTAATNTETEFDGSGQSVSSSSGDGSATRPERSGVPQFAALKLLTKVDGIGPLPKTILYRATMSVPLTYLEGQNDSILHDPTVSLLARSTYMHLMRRRFRRDACPISLAVNLYGDVPSVIVFQQEKSAVAPTK